MESNWKNLSTYQTPTNMRKITEFGPKYGPCTKKGAAFLYQMYVDAFVLGSADQEICKKYMAFYKMYL